MVMLRTLTAADFDAVCASFVEAFSDYVVPFSPTREQLTEMCTRRGYVPRLSVGAFDDRLVGFTLNGIEGARGYDTGTGVIRSHRRRGLGRAMLDFVEPILRQHGCEKYVLEVIDTNHRAHALYVNAGFVETRGLQCWTFESSSRRVVQSPRLDSPRRLDDSETRQLWWDFEPSWQNSTASIHRAHDVHVVLGDDDAYAVVFPERGDLAQIAVRPEARRRGIAKRLLHEAAELAGKPLRIMNVDERNEGMARLLESVGAKQMVRQIEMVKPL